MNEVVVFGKFMREYNLGIGDWKYEIFVVYYCVFFLWIDYYVNGCKRVFSGYGWVCLKVGIVCLE